MRITDYEVFDVPPRWQFLRIETSDGHVGWGAPILEGRAETVATAVRELMDTYLVGESPLPIEDHWQTMYRSGFYRGGPILMSALSGIDQALWDLKGKHFDAPVYELLGGRARDHVRLYQGIGGDSPAETAEWAARAVDDGFTMVKTALNGPFRRVERPAVVDRVRERVGAIREAVGPEVDIGLDFHGRVAASLAKPLAAALEEFDPMFYEEPVLPEHNDVLSGIAAHTSVPIATGERLFSRWDFKHVFEDGSVDIVQPDLSHAGGITEVKKIAAMAEAYDIALAPHCPLGPIALAACLHVDACSPNALVQEQRVHRPDYTLTPEEMQAYVENPSVFDLDDGGYVDLPDGPGLGVEIDERHVRSVAGETVYEIPAWRHDDGSVAEW